MKFQGTMIIKSIDKLCHNKHHIVVYFWGKDSATFVAQQFCKFWNAN